MFEAKVLNVPARKVNEIRVQNTRFIKSYVGLHGEDLLYWHFYSHGAPKRIYLLSIHILISYTYRFIKLTKNLTDSYLVLTKIYSYNDVAKAICSKEKYSKGGI